MNLQIETVTTNTGKMDVIRDIENVKRIIAITEKAMDSIRSCGHKPGYESGDCKACEALAEWDAANAGSELRQAEGKR